MLRIVVIAFALTVCSGPVMAEKASAQQAKKGHSFEECQKRARASGNMWMGTNGRHFSNPTNPNAKGFMAQCMRGEV
jgi:hypothetical protein